MGYVVRLEGYTPGQRDDAPWTEVRVLEGPARQGPWTVIDTQPLDPLDADPLAPAERNITTTEATSAQDWFMVVFRDADGNSQEAAPVYFPNPAQRPLTTDVGTLLWARTKDAGGNTDGVFTETTRPTASQVDEFIDTAVGDVMTRVNVMPQRCWSLGREAATIRAAMLIELSFRPEQARDTESAYMLLRDEWRDLMGGGPSGQPGRLIEAITDPAVGSSVIDSVRTRSVMTEGSDCLVEVANLNV